LIKQLNIYIIILILFIKVGDSFSQSFTRANDWKRYRKEVVFQIGASQFLGDLGGLNKIGTDFSPVDLEFKLTRPAVTIAYRYKLLKNLNWHSSFNYLLVAGDDKLTTEPYRNNRNLNFKSNVFELATRIEVSLFSNKIGHRYGISNTMGRRKRSRSYEFIGFIGIGGFYFNPKGRNPISGVWTKLEPLHTEGQGLPGGPSQYKKVAISVPMGIAYRMILSKEWCVGIELNYRKTFTDYMDDVSSVYYDRYALEQAYGSTSLLMADPSLGNIPGATAPDGSGNGAQRGDKNKDSFLSIQITVGHFFAPKRGKARLRSKF
jgi:hypothetical protein